MQKKKQKKIIVIVGPTASGKTSLSIKLAKKVNGEIVSADSRQVYRGLDIGSGKVTKKETRGIPHHLLDVANPKRQFTVAEYKTLAERAIADILSRDKTPIVVGGTGFYIEAIVDGLVLPRVLPNKKLRTSLAKKTPAQLFSILKKIDPKRARTIDAQNPMRLIRAIEIVQALGAVPRLQRKPRYDADIIGIALSPEKLRENIHARLMHRMKHGMVQEVQKLHAHGLSWKRMEELGLEYRYLARYLQKKMTLKEMLRELEHEIWLFSKRQMTWFKRDKRIRWRKV